MATAILMPKLGLTMEEGTIVQWHKQDGDLVEKGDLLLEITTEKVNSEIDSPISGILRGIRVAAEETALVGRPLAYIVAPGEAFDVPKADEIYNKTVITPTKQSQEIPTPLIERPTPVAFSSSQGTKGMLVSTIAARIAADRGVDLAQIQATGYDGRIMKRDVLAYLETQVSQKQPASNSGSSYFATPIVKRIAREQGVNLTQILGSGPRGLILERDMVPFLTDPNKVVQNTHPSGIPVLERHSLTGRRKIIAERMQKSVQEAPHIQLSVDINMSQALKRRQGSSLTALITWISARTLSDHPFLNASLQDQEIVIFKSINIGIAVDTDEGLIVPVVQNANNLSLKETDATIRDLAQRAQQGNLTMEEISNGTFTISNLGMMGIDRFTAIINPPQVAVMAIGRVSNRPWVVDESTISICPVMNVTISADHRILDGANVARFLQDFQKRIS